MSTGLDPQQSDLTSGFVPFPADRAEEYRRAGYWTGRSLDSILTDAAAHWPDRAAVVDREDRDVTPGAEGELAVIDAYRALGLETHELQPSPARSMPAASGLPLPA